MCGLIVAIASNGRSLPEDIRYRISAALESIKHRGPDGDGLTVDEARRVAMGHVRLAIVDIDNRSNQPFESDCGRYALTFNGEIYNYIELREELLSLGHRFRTKSDTEVLLRSLVQWGSEAVPRLNGMWAFAFVDFKEDTVLVARDRWGVKPLYELNHGGVVYLGSEVKGLSEAARLMPAPATPTIRAFLAHSEGAHTEETWFSGIKRFPAGTLRMFRSGVAGPDVSFWQYPACRDVFEPQFAVRRFGELLHASTAIRLRSDVPVGLSLSGGLDSAAISHCMGLHGRDRALALTYFDDASLKTELPLAEETARVSGMAHLKVNIGEDGDIQRDLSTCIFFMESAHTSTAVVPYLRVCRAARREVKVLVEGQGADELLAGYSTMLIAALADELAAGRGGNASRNLLSAVHNLGVTGAARTMARMSANFLDRLQPRIWGRNALVFDEEPKEDSFYIQWGSQDNLQRAILHWHTTGLRNLLHYGDAISMGCGIEARCPFLDVRLVEFAFRCSAPLLVSGGFGKAILRNMLSSTPLSHLAWQRRKYGFHNGVAERLRRNVLEHGWDTDGLSSALDYRLVDSRIRDPRVIARLPTAPFYRILGTIEWCRLFQTGRNPRATAQAKRSFAA